MDADIAPVKMAMTRAMMSTITPRKMLRRRWRCLNSGVSDLRLVVAVLDSGWAGGGVVLRCTGWGVRRPISPLVPGMGRVEVCPCSRASIRRRRS